MNQAFVFLKPHAVTDAAKAFLRAFLARSRCQVVREGVLSSEAILGAGIIDEHYAALAKNAMKVAPTELPLSAEVLSQFESKYGESWSDAAKAGRLLNLALYASRNPGCVMQDVEAAWRAGPTLKLSPGTYISRINQDTYVVNGFYGSMREKFIAPGVSVAWFSVQFRESELSWKDFRSRVIGATDPAKAEPTSIRYQIRESWQELGLKFQPSTADNAVHASAGPIEALRERMAWLGVSLENDDFGKQLVESGVSSDLIERACNNATILLADGSSGPAFDVLEDRNSSEVLSALKSIGAD